MAGGKTLGCRALQSVLVLIVLASVSGCVKATESESEKLYAFEPYVFLIGLVGSLVAIPAGWFLRKKSGRLGGFGWTMLVVGPLLLVLIVPGLLTDFVKVDDNGFDLKTGFWFSPTRHTIDFNKVTSITLTDEVSFGRRGKKVSYFLLCNQPAGPSVKVPVGDMMKYALDDILLRASVHGVTVQNQADDQ